MLPPPSRSNAVANRIPRITKRSVDAVKTGGTDTVYWDGELTGFGLRVRRSGRKSYVVQTRSRHFGRPHAVRPQGDEAGPGGAKAGRPEGAARAASPPFRSMPMTLPETISADYTLRPNELAEVLALLVEARQPTMVWGPPGAAKSMIARQAADAANRNYVDVRALLLDPVDLRGIPWRDSADRTRWAPPVFLPPSDDPGLWLINLEELPSAVPMVQAALYQLFLERKCGEYELPEGASLIACGNRDADRAVVHRMPAPLSNRLVHLEIRVDANDWCAWGAANGIAPEVLFFIELQPDLLHDFDPQSKEHAFPSPRSWEFASNIVKNRNGLDPEVERALFRGTVGEAAAVQFTAFLKVWRELPHPRAIINDPENADIPENASTLMALCGSLYRMASDVTLDAIVTYATRLRREVGESLVGACVRREPALQRSPAFIRWAAAKTQ